MNIPMKIERVDLDVQFSFSDGQIEDLAIFVDGSDVDIHDLMSDEIVSKIAQECYEYCQDREPDDMPEGA